MIQCKGFLYGLGVRIDIHLRDIYGCTLRQEIERAHPGIIGEPQQQQPAEKKDEAAHSWILTHMHIAELERQWKEIDRPFILRQLTEIHQLVNMIPLLILGYIDGTNLRGEDEKEYTYAADEEQARMERQAAESRRSETSSPSSLL